MGVEMAKIICSKHKSHCERREKGEFIVKSVLIASIKPFMR